MGVFGDEYEFRAESIAILTDLTTDDASRQRAYDDASSIYQEATLLTNFVDRADRLTQTFGKFKAIVSVKEIETLNTIRGKTARVEYSFRFENVSSPLHRSPSAHASAPGCNTATSFKSLADPGSGTSSSSKKTTHVSSNAILRPPQVTPNVKYCGYC